MKQKNKKRKLKKIQSSQAFLPILDICGDIIMTKDGRYTKIMEFSPINFDLRSPDEQETIISSFAGTVKNFPANTHLKITTTPADLSRFTSELLDIHTRETSEPCKEMILDQVDMLNRVATTGVSRRFFLSFDYDEGVKGLQKKPKFPEIRHSLNQTAAAIAASLENCGNGLISYPDKDYTMSAVYATMCKAQSEQVRWNDRKEAIYGNYRAIYGDGFDKEMIPVPDMVSPYQMNFSESPQYAVIDGSYITYCYLPSSAYPVKALGGWLQILFGYMDGVDLDFFIHKEPAESVMWKLALQLKNNVVRGSSKDTVAMDYDNVLSAIEAGYYLKNGLAGGEDLCYMSTILTITGSTLEEMNVRLNAMTSYFARCELKLRRCTFQQKEAFLSTLLTGIPDKTLFKKSKRNILSSQLGSCYPFTAYELCDEGGILMGFNAKNGSPAILNPFNSATYSSGNAVILGPSGSGKSYMLMTTLLRFRAKGVQTFVVAPLKAHEFYRATQAVGGEIIRIAPDSKQTINIMEIRKKDTTVSDLLDGVNEAAKSSLLACKVEQLHAFFSLLVPDMTPTEKNLLDEALTLTYKSFGITVRNGSLIDPVNPRRYRTMPTLGDLYKELVKTGDEGKRVRDAMQMFVTGSASSFNAQTNVNLDNKFVLLDVSGLTPSMTSVCMFIALDYVMDKCKEDRTKRKIIAIDEMWSLLRASTEAANFIFSTVKTIRAYSGSCIMATQDVEDILQSEYGAAIINNTKIKFLMPMDKKEAEAVSKVIDLTSVELKKLKKTETLAANAKRKPTDCLMIANSNHIFITIRASSVEHDLITTAADDLARIARQRAMEQGRTIA